MGKIGPGAILIAALIAVWVLLPAPNNSTPTNASSQRSAPAGVSVSEVRQACMTAVQRELRSPGSAKWVRVTDPDRQPDGRYFVVLEVDSQNGFGALIRSGWGCAWDDGRVTEVSQVR